jgi:hypothetical protein
VEKMRILRRVENIEYIAFIIGRDLLNYELSKILNDDCYILCKRLAKEFLKSELNKKSVLSEYDTLIIWLDENKLYIGNEIKKYR